jgi:hypothetical protein
MPAQGIRLNECSCLLCAVLRSLMIFLESKLIEQLPTPLRIEDFSELKHYLTTLKLSGVEDVAQLLEANDPDFLQLCLKKIKLLAANQSTLELYEAANLEQLQHNFHHIFRDEVYPAFKKCLIALWNGALSHADTMVNYSLKGKRLVLRLHAVCLPNTQHNPDLYLISSLNIHPPETPHIPATDHHLPAMIFQQSPVAMLICDVRYIKNRFVYLLEIGIDNLADYIESHHDFVDQCWVNFAVLDGNQAFLDLFEVQSVADYVQHYRNIHQVSLRESFCTLLKHLWRDFRDPQAQPVSFSFENNTHHILLQYQILTDNLQQWDTLLMCMTDITEPVQIDSFQHTLDLQHPISKLQNEKFLRQELKRLHQEFIHPISCIYIQINEEALRDTQAKAFLSAALLSRLGDILRHTIKKPLSASHLKNNEIVIMMPGFLSCHAQAKIQEIQALLVVDQEFYQSIPLHIRMGYATQFPEESLEQMIVRADQNLHQHSTST